MAIDDQTAEIEQLLRRGETEAHTHTFARLADLYRQGGEHERALSVIREGLGHHPYYLDARLLHARVLLELGRDEAARVEFEHILTLDPANPLACMALRVESVETGAGGADGAAATEDWLGQLEEAWQTEEADGRPTPEAGAAGTARPGGVETATLARLYARQGLFERAIGVYEQMLSEDPDNAGLRADLAELQRQEQEAAGPSSETPVADRAEPAARAEEIDTAEPVSPVAVSGPVPIREQLRRILDGEVTAKPD